jgi:hypothetical protein
VTSVRTLPVYIATGKPKGTELMQKRMRDKGESIAQIKVNGISLPTKVTKLVLADLV